MWEDCDKLIRVYVWLVEACRINCNYFVCVCGVGVFVWVCVCVCVCVVCVCVCVWCVCEVCVCGVCVCVCVCGLCGVHTCMYSFIDFNTSKFYNTLTAFSTILNQSRSSGSSVVSCEWRDRRTDVLAGIVKQLKTIFPSFNNYCFTTRCLFAKDNSGWLNIASYFVNALKIVRLSSCQAIRNEHSVIWLG